MFAKIAKVSAFALGCLVLFNVEFWALLYRHFMESSPEVKFGLIFGAIGVATLWWIGGIVARNR